MNQNHETDLKTSIEYAKEIVKRAYGHYMKSAGESQRPWKQISIDSYENPAYRIELYVYEGSPAKGYIIANYGTRTLTVFNGHDQKLKQLRWNFQ